MQKNTVIFTVFLVVGPYYDDSSWSSILDNENIKHAIQTNRNS